MATEIALGGLLADLERASESDNLEIRISAINGLLLFSCMEQLEEIKHLLVLLDINTKPLE